MLNCNDKQKEVDKICFHKFIETVKSLHKVVVTTAAAADYDAYAADTATSNSKYKNIVLTKIII